jgi:hypothetical protein
MKSSRSKLPDGRIPKKAGSGSKRLRNASPNEDGYNLGHQQRPTSSLVQVLQQHPTGFRVTVQPSAVRVLQQHPTGSRVTVQPSVPTTVLQQLLLAPESLSNLVYQRRTQAQRSYENAHQTRPNIYTPSANNSGMHLSS